MIQDLLVLTYDCKAVTTCYIAVASWATPIQRLDLMSAQQESHLPWVSVACPGNTTQPTRFASEVRIQVHVSEAWCYASRRVWQLRHQWNALQQGAANFSGNQAPSDPPAILVTEGSSSGEEDAHVMSIDQRFRAELEEAKHNSK